MLIQYIRHNDSKFDYDNEGIANRKHIVAETIRYIVKETNNIDETLITGVEETDCLGYENNMEFYNLILLLKPKDVKDKGISQQALYKIKTKIKGGKHLKSKAKIVKQLISIFNERNLNIISQPYIKQ